SADRERELGHVHRAPRDAPRRRRRRPLKRGGLSGGVQHDNEIRPPLVRGGFHAPCRDEGGRGKSRPREGESQCAIVITHRTLPPHLGACPPRAPPPRPGAWPRGPPRPGPAPLPARPGHTQWPAGTAASFEGHAVGTQNYACQPIADDKFAWTLFTPQATLFDEVSTQLTTHFFSPNPFEAGVVRPTWQHSADTSAVWGQGVGSSTDASYVAPGAIAWLLIRVVGAEEGPTGGSTLAVATYIHRVNTSGG